MGQKIILDANILVALYRPDDSTQLKALKICKQLRANDCQFVSINLVVQEAATVVSMRMGMPDVRKFYAGIPNTLDEIIPLEQDLEQMTWNIFLKQTKKGTSFIDCANLAAKEKYHLDKILSFDDFYDTYHP